MESISETQLHDLAARMILGTSYSVSMMGFQNQPLFRYRNGLLTDDMMALSDSRLYLRALLKPLNKVISNQAELFSREGIFEELREGPWSIRIPNAVPPAHLLLVDNEVALYSGLEWNEKKNDQIFLVQDTDQVSILTSLFENAWNGSSSLIYQDPLKEEKEEKEKPSPILMASEERWREIIQYLHSNPNELYGLTPRRFEELIAELLDRDGMDVELTPASKDGGRDVLAYANTSIGRHLFYVECKRYSPGNPVGVKLVRELYGVLEAHKATAGMIVTTSNFTKGAVDFQSAKERGSGLSLLHSPSPQRRQADQCYNARPDPLI